ncbi:MAG: homocysteine S-methyltransferase family protein [Acidobacteria bacterium]|nr:homocysteine S-methyltransferase family protein [Acidobacteriota bacterium]
MRSAFSDRPRWVAGSIGPGTKAPSLGQATFDDLERSYRAQALGLIEGGVDAILIETAYDLLQVAEPAQLLRPHQTWSTAASITGAAVA